MIEGHSNLTNEQIEEKLDSLWKQYAKQFNNIGKNSYANQSEILASLLQEIRSLEKLKKG